MTVTLSRWGKAPYVFINGDLPESVTGELDTELRYEDPDAQYTDAWKRGDWDGYHRVLYITDDGTYYFPVGLLSRVRDVLDVFEISYEIEGLVRPGRGSMGYEWLSEHSLRGYQEDAVDDCLRNGCGLVVLPTAAGKTFIGIRLLYELQQPAIVFCHRQEIADQWVERIESVLGQRPTECYRGTRENSDLMVALYQSVYEGGEIRDDVRLNHPVVLFDESHRVGADTFSKVALACNAEYRYGFTATPNREDNATIRVIGGTGPIVADLSAERMIEDGWLAEPEWRVEKPRRQRGYNIYDNWRDEYRAEVVENEQRNNLVAQTVSELDRPTLVTVERITHGERLEAKIDGGVFVHGDASYRDAVIQAFRDGHIDVLIATRQIVGEGFNVPDIASFVIAGGMKSPTSMIQQVGRALRPDTDTATIVDFADSGRWIGSHYDSRIKTYQQYYGKYGP